MDNDDIILCELVEDNNEISKSEKKVTKKQPLQTCFQKDSIIEIGVDEVGRGPLFGRVYTAAVILPKDDHFDHSKMKDSKTFHSEKKIREVAEYIKQNAIAWSVTFEDEKTVDEINILQATQKSMHHSILLTMEKYYKKSDHLLFLKSQFFQDELFFLKIQSLY